MPAPESESEPESDTTVPADPDFPTTRHVLEADCTRCPNLVEHRECISWGTGPLEASEAPRASERSSEAKPRETDVFVVGEAPGYGNPDADRWKGGNWTGKAYTSRHSGRRIRRLLEGIGFGDAYYTNAVKCFPADEDDPTTNREPTAAEREACRGHLLTELELVSPTVVLATGKHATSTVLAAEGRTLDGFLKSVLEPVRCETLSVWLLPILHPSYQDVWIGRLGYDPDEYEAAIREALEELCLPPNPTDR